MSASIQQAFVILVCILGVIAAIVGISLLIDFASPVQVRTSKLAGEHFNFRCPLDGEYKIGANWKETH